MKKQTKSVKAVKVVKAVKAVKVSAPAPAPAKIRKGESSTFRLNPELKQALISHSFSGGYNGNMSLALCAILRNALL